LAGGANKQVQARDATLRVRLGLTREALARARRKALRQRCWYRALNNLERSIVDLTIRCTKQVRSRKLQRALGEILSKLCQVMKPDYLGVVTQIGRKLARDMSQLALSWGNTEAAAWRHDRALARYLGETALKSRSAHAMHGLV